MARPFIPVPNTAFIEMVYSYAGSTIENTFHVQKSTPFTAAELRTLALAFNAWDGTTAPTWASIRTQNSILTTIKSRALDSAAAPIDIYVLPVPRAGAVSAGINLPGNVTFALTWQTGLAGRSQRGRLYFPGLNGFILQGTPNQNLVAASWANDCVTRMNNLISQISALGSGHKLVVTSYMSNGVWRAVGQNTIILNAAYANLAVDNQRRRLAGRGL